MSPENPQIITDYQQLRIECVKCGCDLEIKEIIVSCFAKVIVKPHNCPLEEE